MNPYQFCQNQIEAWEHVRRLASDPAALAVFNRAESPTTAKCKSGTRLKTPIRNKSPCPSAPAF
ncbi:TPA: hypothetical protein WI660_000587 [Neisseria meningitidis]